mgnify:CR=1 FL=1
MSASCRPARLLRHDNLASGVYCSAKAFAWGGFRKQLLADVSCMPRSATADRLPQTLSISHREGRKSGPNSERGSTGCRKAPVTPVDLRWTSVNSSPQEIPPTSSGAAPGGAGSRCAAGRLLRRFTLQSTCHSPEKRKLSRRRCVRRGTDAVSLDDCGQSDLVLEIVRTAHVRSVGQSRLHGGCYNENEDGVTCEIWPFSL